MGYGVDRMVADLRALGFERAEATAAADGSPFALLKEYTVPLGRFAGRTIDLALPAPTNYPQGVGSAVHVKASPQLLPDGAVAGRQNVIASPLGLEWRYWSHNFGWAGERSTRELMTQVNRILLDA